MDHPLPWLRFVEADDIENEDSTFEGFKVESPTGERLGALEGFIVDSGSGRPYYAVVDSGGWFKSKHFLLPIGHTRLDADRDALVADLTRDRIDHFPGFDLHRFEELTQDDIRRLNDETCQVCNIEDITIVYSLSEPYSAAWDRPDYQPPEWWGTTPTAAAPRRSATAKDVTERSVPPPVSAASRGSRSAVPFERMTARGEDPSPHSDGRAQPGDVIGIETGGEQTHIGETAEDENSRRRRAEETNAKRST